MGWYVFFGTLASFGFLCGLWALTGWLLPGGRGGVIVCFCKAEKGIACVRRCCWLRSVGLLHTAVIAVDCGMTPRAEKELDRLGRYVEICSLQALACRLELERDQIDGTGIGDHSGHH